MSNPNTSEKSTDLDRQENLTKGNVSVKKVALYSYDSGTDTINPVKANSSGSLQVGGTVDLKVNNTILFASVSVSSAGDNQIVAGVASNKIKVLSATLVSSGTVSVKWRSATNDKSGAMPLVTNSGFVLPASSPGQGHYLETNTGEALNINLSGAVQVSGHISYYIEA